MDVCQQYEVGLWVPSYYGLKFSVAQKRSGMSTKTEMDLAIKVQTLKEAQAECDRRNP